MDWDKLRIFHAVAEAGSFTHAGASLNLSQSAISRQISGLEDSLDILLFHRHARGLVLTEQGEILYKTAKDIFARLSMVEGQLSDSRQRPTGPLRITIANMIGVTWLAPNLAGFRKEHPDIQTTLLLDDRIYNLGMREADVAIRLFKPQQPDLIQSRIAELDFVLCAHESYFADRSMPETAQDLKQHILLGFPLQPAPPYAQYNWLFKMADIDPDMDRNLVLLNSLNAIWHAMQGGVGIAAIPYFLVKDRKDIIQLKNMPDHPIVNMYFVYPEERRNSARIGALREFLHGLVEKTPFKVEK